MTALIVLCLPVSAFATTLRLLTDVSLLILDGKKVSSPPLRSVDSIELDNGPHQLVFRVGETIHLSNSEKWLYISPPSVVNFNIQFINQANFCLPRLKNKREVSHFDAASHLELLGGDATLILVKLDILATISTARAIDYEVKVERYNRPMKHTLLPQSVTMTADNSTLLSDASELDVIPSQSQVFTEQRLKYWFKLVGPRMRNTFLQRTEKQPSS